MKEGKEEGGIVNIILLLLIIGVIFVALSYKYEKFDKFKIFHKGEIDHIATQINSPDHVDTVHTELIGRANVTFNKLGMPNLADLLVTNIDPNKMEVVEVQNAAGQTGTVMLCNNSTGRQPKYANKTLFCINGMNLVKSGGSIMCCDPSKPVPKNQIGPFGRLVLGGMDMFQNHPVMGLGAVAFGQFTANYILPKVINKGLKAATKPIFKKIATAYGKKALEKTIISMVKAGSGSARSQELVEDFAKGGRNLIEILEKSEDENLQKIAKKLAQAQKRAGLGENEDSASSEGEDPSSEPTEGGAESGGEDGAESGGEDGAESGGEDGAESGGEDTSEIAAENTSESAAENATETGVEDIGETAVLDTSEEAAQLATGVALEGAAEASLGSLAASSFLDAIPIVGEVVMVVQAVVLVLQMLNFLLNQLDVGGFGQYQDLKTIQTLLETSEKTFINSFKNIGINPPSVFTLDSIASLPNYEKHTKFKNIQQNYSGAIVAYLMNLNNNLNKYISQQDKIILRAALESGQEITENYISSLVPNLHDRPEERDLYIWNYLSKHLDSSELEYISYVPEVTLKTRIGISFNQKGVDEYNKLVDVIIQKNPKKSNPHKVKYTKYYRDLNENNELVQKALPKKFCLIKGLQDDVIEHICTEGMDPKKLAKNFPLRSAVCCGDWCKDDIIKPKDYDVTYNIDTGLCNYTEKYCKEMGFNSMETILLKCDGDGCGASESQNCKLSEGQQWVHDWTPIPDYVVHEWARNPMATAEGVAITLTPVVGETFLAVGAAAAAVTAVGAEAQCAARAASTPVGTVRNTDGQSSS